MGKGTFRMILVVEDEALIRMTAVGMIEEAGYKAMEASSGDQALRMLENGLGFTALFTDVNLRGGMTGLALAQTVRDGWPTIRVVVTSGRFEPVAQKLPPGAVFLPKPYSMKALQGALGLTWCPPGAPGLWSASGMDPALRRGRLGG